MLASPRSWGKSSADRSDDGAAHSRARCFSVRTADSGRRAPCAGSSDTSARGPVSRFFSRGSSASSTAGYDSAGLALLEADGLEYVRAVGNLQKLKQASDSHSSASTTGVGHTRWATHGGVSLRNAHPLTGCDDSAMSIVLNGIVENYRELKESLLAEGHTFSSETDAEVVDAPDRAPTTRATSSPPFKKAYAQLEGHFSIVAIHHDHEGTLVGARCQTPLVVGVGEGEMFLASSIAAFLSETRRVQFIDDDQVVELTPRGRIFHGVDGEIVEPDVTEIDWDEESAEKGGYETFMLKEIYEQPEAVRETIGDRVRGHRLVLEDFGLTELEIQNLRRIVIVACGTAYHAGVVGRYILEEWARVPVEPDIASEWIYRNPVLSQGHARDRHLAVGRDARHGQRDEARPRPRRAHARDHEPDGHADHARGRRGALHALRPRDRRRRLEDLHGAGRAALAGRAQARRDPQDAAAGADRVHPRPAARAAGQDAGVPRRRPSDRRDRAALLREAVLPLPRPPHRPAGRARGRAQAEGDLVHPDRGVLGRRDEARADRAARGGDAGRRRRDRTSTSTTRSSPTSRRRAPAARR